MADTRLTVLDYARTVAQGLSLDRGRWVIYRQKDDAAALVIDWTRWLDGETIQSVAYTASGITVSNRTESNGVTSAIISNAKSASATIDVQATTSGFRKLTIPIRVYEPQWVQNGGQAVATALFHVHMTTQVDNVTGNAEEYTVIYDTEDFDVNGDFDIAAGTFTAPRTGYYQLNAGCLVQGSASHTLALFQIRNVTQGTGTVVRWQDANGLSPDASLMVSDVFSLTAGDVVSTILDVRNGTTTADVRGGVYSHSFFSGFEL